MSQEEMFKRVAEMSQNGTLGKRAGELIARLNERKSAEILEKEAVWVLGFTAALLPNLPIIMSALVTAYYLGQEDGADLPVEFKED